MIRTFVLDDPRPWTGRNGGSLHDPYLLDLFDGLLVHRLLLDLTRRDRHSSGPYQNYVARFNMDLVT